MTCKPKCHYCERADNLARQLCGFWFCFWCLPRALAKGLSYWWRLAGRSVSRRW